MDAGASVGDELEYTYDTSSSTVSKGKWLESKWLAIHRCASRTTELEEA